MLPWETLRARDNRRARRLTNPIALENLEGRQLLSYSSLGYSLPDLRISATAGKVAAWGGTLSVTALVQNIGASTIVEPLSQTPYNQVVLGPDGNPVPPFAIPSTASAPDSIINVILSPRPRSLAGAISIGTMSAPTLDQNNIEQITSSVQLPQHPAGLPSSGVMYLRLQVVSPTNVPFTPGSQTLSAPIPVRFIQNALPQLRATALDVPATLQPGDTIVPTFQITNLGPASTNAQGPVQVALVASVSPDFNLGSSIVALYTLPNGVPGASDAPTKVSHRRHGRLFGRGSAVENVDPGNNVVTFTGTAVTLPTSPEVYYLGLVIDPDNTLSQLSVPANRLEQIHRVGPATAGLPPAGVLSSSPLSQEFPNPPDGEDIGLVNPNGV